jgi:hypothetical protein
MTDTITAVRAPLSIPLDDVMVDLETLGTRAGCVVVSIGAVKFSPTTGFVDVDNAFYEVVDVEYSMRAGLVAEAGTLKWWMKQSDEARAVFSSQDAVSLPAALVRFAEWVSDEGDYGDVKMWGNGAGFDNPILSAAFAVGGIKQPWYHWNDRCYRTKMRRLQAPPVRAGGRPPQREGRRRVSGEAPVQGVGRGAAGSTALQGSGARMLRLRGQGPTPGGVHQSHQGVTKE